METVKECISDLNKGGFYKNNVENSIFKNFNLVMCYLSIIKYENKFYKNQGLYTKNNSNSIIESLKGKICEQSLPVGDGACLNIWDINPFNSSKYIITFNGIGTEKSNITLQYAYKKFVENGWGVVAFDYRGRGKSRGVFCQKNALKDSFAVWNYLLSKGIKPYEIGLVGHSMGAAVALDFVSKNNCAFVILINPFNKAADMVKNIALKLDLPEFIKNTVKKLPDFLIPLKNRFNNEKALASVQIPALIMHTKKDETTPVELCRKLYKKNKYKNNVSYIELEGCEHEIDEEKLNICLEFIDKSDLWFFD